ncbi:MAG: Ig-like domain-containing protein, partial [bacterium]
MKRFSIIKIIIFIAFVLLSFQVMTIPAKAQLTDQDIQTLNEEILSNGYNFTIGLNSATARSLHDLAGLVPPENWDKDASTDVSRFQAMEDSDGGYLPPSLNWYDINPVKDQGTCRACWAFSTVSVLESAITISSGVEIDLSEQYLISCNCDNNWDCTNGGWFAHDYHEWKNCLEEEETGAVLETEFPYGASDTPCTGSYTRHKIINWAFISSTSPIPTVNEIKRALLNYGPISAAVVADSFFQAYTGGIFDGCINDVNNVNHAIVLTGWCDDVTVPSGGYWYLKNSWGEGWGQNGYMRIAYGANCVGYAANFITPAVAPVAYFTGSPTFGIPPLTVQFTDLSLYNPDAWSWDFGDGNISCEQNPTHIFTDPGIYTVSLIAHSAFGPSDPLDFENYITIVVENTRTFCDSFDTNKPSLNPYLGNWEVVDNKYQGYYSSKGFSFGDVGEVEKAIIALDWTSLSSNGWLMGRIDFGWKNEANFRCIEMKDGENRWHIREYKDGVRSSLANVKETIETNKEYHLEVNIDENGLVTLFVDGVEKLSYDFGTPVSGRLGVGVENSKSRFDNICITVENKTPVAKDGSYNTDEDQSISDEMYASDAEDDNLTYSIVSPPVMGIVEITDAATGDFTYTPNENDYGDDSFTFKVNDGTIDSNTATVTITIDPVNDKPVASDSTFSTNEDVVITEDSLDASDIDEKDNLTYSIVFPPYPDMGIVEITNAATGAFTYTPNENANGTDSFAFKVNDGTIDSNTATVTIEIVPVNDAPVITSQAPKTAIEDEMYTYNPTALDVDHVNLTWSLSTDTEGMIFDSATDTISWTPGEGVLTSDIVLLTVSDAQGDSDSQEFTISVTPVNDPPVITSEAPTTATEDEMYTYNPTALDVDDVNLTWSLSTAPEGMSIDGAGKISWTPGEGVLTSDIVLLTVSDAQGD